jgi:hypothetical protein
MDYGGHRPSSGRRKGLCSPKADEKLGWDDILMILSLVSVYSEEENLTNLPDWRA